LNYRQGSQFCTPSDQLEGLGSVSEQLELTVTSQQEVALEQDSKALPAGHLEVREKSAKESPDNDTSDIKQMLAGIMAVIQQSNANLQEQCKITRKC
jgi:hypothetical protein